MSGEHIVVIPYDPDWRRCFEVERVLLDRVLAPWLEGGIHHVGATSIPELAAKPIIDIIAGVRNLRQARAAYGPLGECAYVSTPHRPGIAHHFSKPSALFSEVTHHLHLTQPGGDLWVERLTFRNALRNDSKLVAEYAALKVRLAQEHSTDLGAYTADKRTFVVRVLGESGVQLGQRQTRSSTRATVGLPV